MTTFTEDLDIATGPYPDSATQREAKARVLAKHEALIAGRWSSEAVEWMLSAIQKTWSPTGSGDDGPSARSERARKMMATWPPYPHMGQEGAAANFLAQSAELDAARVEVARLTGVCAMQVEQHTKDLARQWERAEAAEKQVAALREGLQAITDHYWHDYVESEGHAERRLALDEKTRALLADPVAAGAAERWVSAAVYDESAIIREGARLAQFAAETAADAARAEVARLTDAAKLASEAHMRTVAERDELAARVKELEARIRGAVSLHRDRGVHLFKEIDVTCPQHDREYTARVLEGLLVDAQPDREHAARLRGAKAAAFSALVDKLPDLPHGALAVPAASVDYGFGAPLPTSRETIDCSKPGCTLPHRAPSFDAPEADDLVAFAEAVYHAIEHHEDFATSPLVFAAIEVMNGRPWRTALEKTEKP